MSLSNSWKDRAGYREIPCPFFQLSFSAFNAYSLMYAHVPLMPCRWSPLPLVAPEPVWYSVVVFPSDYSIASLSPNVNTFFKKNKYFFKFFLFFSGRETIDRMRACGGCGAKAGEYLFCRHLFFPIGTPDQKKKKKRKEPKEKQRFIIYIFCF